MNIQQSISKATHFAAVIILATCVSSAHAQAIRPRGAAQVGRISSAYSSQSAPSGGPWPERIASFLQFLWQGGGGWFR